MAEQNARGPDRLLEWIARLDQQRELIKLHASLLAASYQALISDGMPREDAVELVNFQETFIILSKAQGEPEGDDA